MKNKLILQAKSLRTLEFSKIKTTLSSKKETYTGKQQMESLRSTGIVYLAKSCTVSCFF